MGSFSDEVTELWVKELMCLDGRIGSVLPLFSRAASGHSVAPGAML